MAYVAVKGGERAIDNAHAWLAEDRRGDPAVGEIGTDQIAEQLGRAVDRVMAEGSLYDRELAALAVKQAQGDLIEAAFLLRAYRTTLPRFAYSTPLDTSDMQIRRRISAVFKDLPGGQVLGPTYDYTHRLLDFALAAEGTPELAPQTEADTMKMPRVSDLLGHEGLIEGDVREDCEPGDLTREPLAFPASRDLRLQALARGDEGFLLGLGYSTQRGWGGAHPFVGELRVGEVAVEIVPPELGFAIDIGDITLTECQMVNQFKGSKTTPAQFTRGYGLAFGHAERKAMSMALVDRAMRAEELGEDVTSPAQNIEFVLYHSDNIEGTGFVEHLKLPHYVDFQSELEIDPPHARRSGTAEGRGRMNTAAGYNFAYLDEQTKRMIRRAILKAVAIPGHQVPFGSREMPLPYGWGTGGIQVTASVLGEGDVLKVIDQGADDTTNAVSIRRFFARTAGVRTTTHTEDATLIQTRHRIPEMPLTENQIIVYQVPQPEPLSKLEPSRAETRRMHALSEYGLMHVKLYEDITRFGQVSISYDYPVMVNFRYLMAPSPIPAFDNPKLHMMPALQLFGAGREKRIYAIPPYTEVRSLDFDDHKFRADPRAACLRAVRRR